MLNETMRKTRLTQNTKAKHISNAKKKKKKGRGKNNDIITWSLFPSTPWKNFFVLKTLDLAVRGKN